MKQDESVHQNLKRGFAVHKQRCPKCMLVQGYCICPELYPLESEIFVSFICHFLELKRPSNTARIGALALKNSEILTFGTKEGFDWESAEKPGFEQILLFPSGPDIRTAKDDLKDKKLQILVPDGNWPQASRIAKKALRSGAAKAYSLSIPEKSRYRLRKDKTRTEGFATLESLAYCFEALGKKHVAAHLNRAFDNFVEAHLSYKLDSQLGKVRSSD